MKRTIKIKTHDTDIKLGMVFSYQEPLSKAKDMYILSSVGGGVRYPKKPLPSMVVLISFGDGNRWHTPVSVGNRNSIMEKEWKKITAGCWDDFAPVPKGSVITLKF